MRFIKKSIKNILYYKNMKKLYNIKNTFYL